MPKTKKDKTKLSSADIRIDGKATLIALGKVGKALNNKATAVQLEFTKTSMLMSASSDHAAIQLVVSECFGEGKFSIGIEQLSHLLGGRKEFDCSIKQK